MDKNFDKNGNLATDDGYDDYKEDSFDGEDMGMKRAEQLDKKLGGGEFYSNEMGSW